MSVTVKKRHMIMYGNDCWKSHIMLLMSVTIQFSNCLVFYIIKRMKFITRLRSPANTLCKLFAKHIRPTDELAMFV